MNIVSVQSFKAKVLDGVGQQLYHVVYDDNSECDVPATSTGHVMTDILAWEEGGGTIEPLPTP